MRRMKKMTRIEVLRYKSAFNAHGAIEIGFDANFVAETPLEDREPEGEVALEGRRARGDLVGARGEVVEAEAPV